ncbi:Serine/threonine-protein kinase cds1 [Psilocybe cubensis]|uniref:Pkinase-domain-containing protein n=2 Tax=Psilocybe cubensis TaxID=181762 RepID=A0A8H7Y5G6_PSICU|nr:Serine/threonine-protein kinase cds1 [Psilocybe cubensis]KAH9485365.1 Serine/threonine-protein kinase cds1 [Psilocybe cubensis]
MDSLDNMEYEHQEDAFTNEESQDYEQQTQTQSTQQASQPPPVAFDSHLWGFLQPCSAALTRIDFWKLNPRYTIGRNTETNQVVLPGYKVSNTHCTITWDGKDVGSTIIVTDLSSNGTFINGEKIGKNNTRILHEGNEIAFGTSIPQPQNDGLEDYRFVYRHLACGMPTEGLYAHYDLGIELGKGSFATVRKAIHRATGQWYAVKMISASKAVRNNTQSSRNSNLAREISIMEKLEHPNICKLVEVFFQDDKSINLVLEHVEGGDLLEHILKNGGLAEVDARDITYQICDAMAYIHAKGVTHRDLKPENVLLTADKPPKVKVADFGLAKVVDSLTMLRTMCGTPSYLAPEVVRSDNIHGYDNLVDSWSVGVIVFSMLTNSSPFIEDETADIRNRILYRRVDWQTLSNCPISIEAHKFIRRLLEEDARRRLSLTGALLDPWLANHLPYYPNPDVSMTSVIQNDADMSPDENERPGPAQATTSRVPLQRRSLVLSQAAEAGEDPIEPSWEMIAYANSRNDVADAAEPSEAPVKGQNKRIRADLTPVPEDAVDDTDMNASNPVSQTNGKDGQPRRSTRRNKVARMS